MSEAARRAGAGLAAAAAAAAVTALAGRAAVRRVRSRPDPEAGEPFGILPPEDLGRARSFDGTELAVRAAGPPGAPAVVFSHGITLDMTTWYYQWRALSGRYRCVLYDHRAHGRSGRPPDGDHSLEAVGRDLRAVLDHAVPEGPAVLVGHSMGGMAILALARSFPEELGGRVWGAVLADTAASGILRDLPGRVGSRAGRAALALADRLAASPRRAERIRRAALRWQDAAFLVALLTNFGPEASPAQVDYVTRLSASASVEVWTRMLRALLDMDLAGGVARLTVPALVVVGEHDTLTTPGEARALREALPDARAVVIAGAGHVTMMERHRAFNEVLSGFLERVLARERAAR